MHSTSKGPSHSERGSGLPRMWWPLSRLRVVLVLLPLLLAVLFLVGEQRGRPEQRRRVRQQRKAEMVASRFVRVVHACRGAGTHAHPRQRRKASAPPLASNAAQHGVSLVGQRAPRRSSIALDQAPHFSGADETSEPKPDAANQTARERAGSGR